MATEGSDIMEEKAPVSHGADGGTAGASPTRPWGMSRKRSTSGGGGLLSKIPFMRSTADHNHHRPKSRHSSDDAEPLSPDRMAYSSASAAPTNASPDQQRQQAARRPQSSVPISMAQAIVQEQQQQKTRRRRGSLRKVALLGRGAQRERGESRSLSMDVKSAVAQAVADTLEGARGLTASPSPLSDGDHAGSQDDDQTNGLGIADITPRPSMDGFASRTARENGSHTPRSTTAPMKSSTRKHSTTPERGNAETESTVTSPTMSYSTTDDEDALHMGSRLTSPLLSSSSTSLLRPERASLSSGSESYFPGLSSRTLGHGPPGAPLHAKPSLLRRRSNTTQRATSPLALTSLAGLSTTPLPPPDADWDYAETEWWGWVVLVVTWVVFVMGMGSTLGVWSWAWDVGTTPYAPPELEDDPTLPIVGYYPALIILTGVMAWVWVVVAWVGMKYFRHARVSGD